MGRFKGAALAVCLVAAISGLTIANFASAAGKIRMAIFYYNPSPYGIASLNGAQRAAGKLGVQIDAFDGNNNPQLQTTQIQDAITTGKYKAFWVWGLDDVALTPVINKALAKGIKVANADYTWGSLQSELKLSGNKKFVSTIGQAIAPEATNLEKVMNAACKKAVSTNHCNIAFLPGLSNYPTDTIRLNAMTAYYNGKSQYSFTVMQPGQYDQTTAQNVATSFFSANKDINVFASFADQMTVGGLTALKTVGGYTPGKNIQIIGYGGAREILGLIKSGSVYATLGLYPTAESLLGIKALYDALHGKKVPNVVNIIDPNKRPAIIDKPFLTKHPRYQADWAIQG
jgi:ribose transport system substrate-binding protein